MSVMNARRPISLSILDLIDDPLVFGPWFRGPSWCAWKIFLKALFGVPLSAEELATYRTHRPCASTDRASR